ncbi:oligosaccharide flippase family protein [uncultured Sphingomonas sp.]|uniref:oligosaccharide flippase family protein n=1 Tax=uncultured Sphingomonas sp. TaxID=158754 RepID=UPI0025F9929D|nr:oligosaccharide flippase family protein [uncultured Sphingomonas sp.]
MTSAASPTLSDRLRRFATGGVASIAVGVGITNLLRIASSMTLTRLLDSHAYGVVGVITSVAFALTMLTDLGLYGFIVRHKEGDDPRFLDQVWTIRAVRGFALAAAMAVAAMPIAQLLGKPELGPVLAVWSISFALEGLSSLAFATAVRQQRLWRLMFLDLSSSVTTIIVSIALAVLLRSYWAMVIGMLVGAAAKASTSYLLFRPAFRRPQVDRARMRELWAFSRYIAMSSILSLLIMQSDKVVLAKLMPLAQFGLYAIAITLAGAPTALAGPYASRVLFAVYSNTARTDPGNLRRVLYDARRKVVLLYMLCIGGMIGGAPLLVALLYDPRYHLVAVFLQLILITTLLRLPALAANEALVALGKTRSQFYANVLRIIWLAIGGAVGLWTGNIMLLVAIVGTVEVPGYLCFLFNLRRAGLLNLREEAYGLMAGAVGVGIGWGVATAALTAYPNL